MRKKIPYPNPNYNRYLISKEIVNGTFGSVIRRNRFERYDEPIEIILERVSKGEVMPEDFDINYTNPNTDKLKELSWLPTHRESGDNEKTIAKTYPTSFDYIETVVLEDDWDLEGSYVRGTFGVDRGLCSDYGMLEDESGYKPVYAHNYLNKEYKSGVGYELTDRKTVIKDFFGNELNRFDVDLSGVSFCGNYLVATSLGASQHDYVYEDTPIASNEINSDYKTHVYEYKDHNFIELVSFDNYNRGYAYRHFTFLRKDEVLDKYYLIICEDDTYTNFGFTAIDLGSNSVVASKRLTNGFLRKSAELFDRHFFHVRDDDSLEMYCISSGELTVKHEYPAWYRCTHRTKYGMGYKLGDEFIYFNYNLVLNGFYYPLPQIETKRLHYEFVDAFIAGDDYTRNYITYVESGLELNRFLLRDDKFLYACTGDGAKTATKIRMFNG